MLSSAIVFQNGLMIVTGMGVVTLTYAGVSKILERKGNEKAKADLDTFMAFLIGSGVVVAGYYFVRLIDQIMNWFGIYL